MEFPEMLAHKGESIDVTIQLGPVPKMLSGEEITTKGSLSVSPSEYLLHLPICSYYVKDGNQITIDLKPDADDKSVRLFLLTNAMAAILQQRNKVALHAGAVVTEKGLIIISGDSGAGKSTTISALQQKGYKVFADDVVVLEEDAHGAVIAYASYPTIKLWEDSLDKLGVGELSEEAKLREHVSKYRVHFHEDFIREPLPVTRVFVLKKNETLSAPSIKPLTGVQSFVDLYAQLYRTSQINSAEKRNLLFNSISNLAGKIPVHLIERPIEGNSIENVLALIENVH
jgi:hypothetical protein